jgi:hypothetical protein
MFNELKFNEMKNLKENHEMRMMRHSMRMYVISNLKFVLPEDLFIYFANENDLDNMSEELESIFIEEFKKEVMRMVSEL